MRKIIPNLWFDSEAEEAVNFYVSIFENSRIINIMRYEEEGAKVSGKPVGSVMTVSFKIEEQDFVAINGGPQFTFSPAISLQINCKTQKEIDYFWEKLTDGGKEVQCGWLEDKYGLSWQVVPELLDEMITDPDSKKSQNAMRAMLKMKKIDMAELKRAFEA